MSITLPYASAVNCKFVALPDSLATDNNILKLYNIDGGGGGGTTDAYTKAESDARFFKLVDGPGQTITQVAKLANGIYFGPLYVKTLDTGGVKDMFIPAIQQGGSYFLVDRPNNGQQTIYKSTLNIDYTGGLASSSALVLRGFGAGVGNGFDTVATSSTNGTKHIRFFAAPSALRGEIYDNGTGICYKGNQANLENLNSSYATLGQVTLSGNVTMLAKYSGTLYKIWVPVLTSDNGDFIVSNPSLPQTISNALTVTNFFTADVLKLSATPTAAFNSSTNAITAAQETTTGTIPSSSAVCNWTKNYAIPKTDIVTTVTGVSDTKVPSELAVKKCVYPTQTSVSITITSSPANVNGTLNARVTTSDNGFVQIWFEHRSVTPTINVDSINLIGINDLLPTSANGITQPAFFTANYVTKVGRLTVNGNYYSPTVCISFGLMPGEQLLANQPFTFGNNMVSYNKLLA